MMRPSVETVETDVLVLGSGMAGLRAAIEARRYGVDVLLVDKSLIGVSTNTRFSGGGFKAASKAGGAGSSGPVALPGSHDLLDHFKDTLRIGGFLSDQRLAEALCYEGPSRVQELSDFGLDNFRQRMQQCPCPRGTILVRHLLDAIQGMGIRTRRRLCPVELIKSHDTIVGILGFSLETGQPVAIKAKSTILATGGAGQVFERNESAATLTGDGYAMAYQAGAQLVDMEMVHFEPHVHAEPDLPMMMDRFQSPAGRRGILRNRLGEDFLPNYLERTGPPEAPFEFKEQFGVGVADVRSLVSRAIALEVHAGRGDRGAVLYDLTRVPEDIWQSEIESRYLRNVLCRGYDVTRTPIHVLPAAITTLGGIRIDEQGQSTLNGLYAAGEVTGGVHGANRLGGNALTDCTVFGARAGRSAAKHALATRMAETDNGLVAARVGALGELLDRPASPEGDPEEIRRRIRSVMWQHVGVLRNGEGLEEAVATLDHIQQESVPRVFAGSILKLRTALESVALLATAQMMAISALYRRESRGGHYRLDFPLRDDGKWLCNILVRKGPEQMELSTQPVAMTRFRPEDLSADTPLARVLDGIERLQLERLKSNS